MQSIAPQQELPLGAGPSSWQPKRVPPPRRPCSSTPHPALLLQGPHPAQGCSPAGCREVSFLPCSELQHPQTRASRGTPNQSIPRHLEYPRASRASSGTPNSSIPGDPKLEHPHPSRASPGTPNRSTPIPPAAGRRGRCQLPVSASMVGPGRIQLPNSRPSGQETLLHSRLSLRRTCRRGKQPTSP